MNEINHLRSVHHNHYRAINEHGIYVGVDSYLEAIIIFEEWCKIYEEDTTMRHYFVAEQLGYMESFNFTDIQQYLDSIVILDQYMEFLNE